ncbi:MAG: hypothetical protein KIT34_17040 [Cyanobacteria bacterium TGS_CYA1]|nr:hypothetical protein [Cyanobacteria bacterium TGS_CYA1]
MAKSPALLLLILLLTADCFVLDFRKKEDEKSKTSLASNESRIPALRESIQNGRKADVLLLGSSLVVTAFSFPDFKLGFAPLKQCGDSYVQIKFLSNLVRERTGKSIYAVNLSCLAATPADALLIVKELVKREKLPKTVVYGIEPRAIADNLTPVGGALGGTAALELAPQYSHPNLFQRGELTAYKLSDLILPKDLRNYFNQLQIKLARLGETPDAKDVDDVIASHFWQLFAVRKNMSDIAQARANIFLKSKIATAPATATAPAKQVKVECVSKDAKLAGTNADTMPWDTVSQQRIQTQLIQYKGHYLPCNKAKMEKNQALLEKLAKICRENGTNLYLVKMPITKDNFSLVPAETANGYDANLSRVAERYQCMLLDLRNGFDQSDFMDTVHLNAKGGEKLQKRLAAALDRSIQ